VAKRSIVQRDFSLGELREEFLERDDLELRQRSLRRARNISLLPTGGFKSRPGTSHFITGDSLVPDGFAQVKLADGTQFMAVWSAFSLTIRDSTGATVATLTPPWAYEVYWTLPYSGTLVIGCDAGIFVIKRPVATWSIVAFDFDWPSFGDQRQPYWAFNPGVTLTPSGTTGAITLTASAAVFTAQHVNTVVRYGYREILISTYSSPTSVTGIVRTQLPPTYEITLDVFDVGLWQVGDTVNAATSLFSGVIVQSDQGTKKVWVLALSIMNGPQVGEEISCSQGTAEVSTVTTSTPKASTIWDEALISTAHGYPKAAAFASGRLVLASFRDAPGVVAASSTRAVTDFRAGADDDDAIVRGLEGVRIAHLAVTGDLLVLSDVGTYVVPLRDAVLTPANFNPLLIDKRGAKPTVKPAVVSDAVLFAEAGGGRLAAAFQSGNIYLKWGVRTVSDLHKHLFQNIIRICPPSPNDDDPRVLVVRGDGKITAATWSEDLDSIGFVEWETRGDFIFADVCFSAQFVAVLREIDGDNVRFIERVDPAMMLDCVRGSYFPRDPGAATHLAGEAVTVYQDRFFLADLPVAPDGSIAIDGDEFPVTGGSSSVPQIGFPFTSEAAAWPVEMMDAPYVGLKRVRATKFGVSVQGSIHFDMRCNAKSRTVGAYSFGDDLTQAPPVSERIFMAPVTGRPAHHDLAVIRNDPGPWQVLAMTQEVTD